MCSAGFMKSPLLWLVLLIPSQTTSPCCRASSVIVFSRAWRYETVVIGQPERAGDAGGEAQREGEPRRRPGLLPCRQPRPQPGEQPHAEQGQLDAGQPLRAHLAGEGIEQPERAAAGQETEPFP